MTRPSSDEEAVKKLAAFGLRAVLPEEYTAQAAFDVIRENRRRYADAPDTERLEKAAVYVATGLDRYCEVPPAHAAVALIVAASSLGGFAFLRGFSGPDILQVLAIAADDLRQVADGQQQPPELRLDRFEAVVSTSAGGYAAVDEYRCRACGAISGQGVGPRSLADLVAMAGRHECLPRTTGGVA